MCCNKLKLKMKWVEILVYLSIHIYITLYIPYDHTCPICYGICQIYVFKCIVFYTEILKSKVSLKGKGFMI